MQTKTGSSFFHFLYYQHGKFRIKIKCLNFTAPGKIQEWWIGASLRKSLPFYNPPKPVFSHGSPSPRRQHKTSENLNFVFDSPCLAFPIYVWFYADHDGSALGKLHPYVWRAKRHTRPAIKVLYSEWKARGLERARASIEAHLSVRVFIAEIFSRRTSVFSATDMIGLLMCKVLNVSWVNSRANNFMWFSNLKHINIDDFLLMLHEILIWKWIIYFHPNLA